MTGKLRLNAQKISAELRAHMRSIIERSATKGCGPEGLCWDWSGKPGTGGYGRVSIQGRLLRAHRASLIAESGVEPWGLLALHSCDRPICVAPHHLRWGTHQDNATDASLRDRYPKRRPRTDGLPLAMRQAMHADYWAGDRIRMLASRYGETELRVSAACVRYHMYCTEACPDFGDEYGHDDRVRRDRIRAIWTLAGLGFRAPDAQEARAA